MWQYKVQVSSHGAAGDATMKSDAVLQWHKQTKVMKARLSCCEIEDTERTAVMPRACCDHVIWQG